MVSSVGDRSKASSPAMKKAAALGINTRNVSSGWLEPMALGGASASDEDGSPGGPGTSYQKNFVQLSPHYGPGQNSPKELAALRTTRSLHSLGRAAIFSNNPYVDTAIETLVPQEGLGPSSPASLAAMYAMMPRSAPSSLAGVMGRPSFGRMPKRSSKYAAMQRAKRTLSAGVPFLSEVPFADAVRVCNLAGDKSAMPALFQAYIFSKPSLSLGRLEYYADVLALQPPLIQLQSAAQLLQAGYFFAAVKVVYSDLELLKATLEEMQLLVNQGLEEGNPEVAASIWTWRDIDKELFIAQFSGLRIISYYLEVRKQLRSQLKEEGAVALARVEREMLTKVIADFMTQLTEALEANNVRELARNDDVRVIDAEQRAAERAAAAEKVRMVNEAKASAAAKAKAAAEERKKAAEERARLEAEARRLAAEKKAAKEAAVLAAKPEPPQRALRMGELEVMKERQPGAAEEAALAEAALALIQAAEEHRAAEEEEARAQEAEEAARALEAEEAARAAAAMPSLPPSRVATPQRVSTPQERLSRQASAARALEMAAETAAVTAVAAMAASSSSPTQSLDEASTQHATSEFVGRALATAVISEQASEDAVGIAAEAVAKALVVSASRQGTPSGQGTPRSGSHPISKQGSTGGFADVPLPSGTPPRTPGSRQGLPPSGSRLGSPGMGGSRLGSPGMGGGRLASPGMVGSRLGSPGMGGSRLGSPGMGGSRLGSPGVGGGQLGSFGMDRGPSWGGEGSLSAADQAALLMTPPGSRPGTAGQAGREGIDEGILEMKRQMSDSRKMVEVAAEKLRTSFSRPGSAVLPPISTLAAESSMDSLAQDSRAAQEAQETAYLASLLASPAPGSSHTPEELAQVLDDQRDALERELAAKADMLQRLSEEREALRSSERYRRSSGYKTPPSTAAKKEEQRLKEQEEKRLKELEIRMAAEELAAKRLAEQKLLIEEERRKLDAEREALNKQLEIANKAAMNVQVTKSMRAFQDQLAQTVKMAAMLQAQRIMTGGAGPSMTTSVPTVSLPEEVDEPPSKEEIIEYAQYLGMDPVTDADLLYVAEWALMAPVPEGWTVHLDTEGHEFFHNNATNRSQYEAPLDEHYKEIYNKKRAEKHFASFQRK